MDMIVYDSRANSGTTKHFAKQLGRLFGIPVVSVGEVTAHTEIQSYVLCTYTIGYGEVPETTQAFLDQHASTMIGVVANGSSNFRVMGLFGRAGDKIADRYGVELFGYLDMGGTKEDLHRIAARLAVLSGKALKPIPLETIYPQSTYINGQFRLCRMA